VSNKKAKVRGKGFTIAGGICIGLAVIGPNTNSWSNVSRDKDAQAALMVVGIVLLVIGITRLIRHFSNGQPLVFNRNNADSTEEILKYKQLLDLGAITKAEFEAKKRQILGDTGSMQSRLPTVSNQKIRACPKCKKTVATPFCPVCKIRLP
jgi:hypothetical protein